ncbi:MAG: hypothetical protein HXX15_05615 [Rhodopseudomonas sp.]|uniref:hypothetical protein n=1 Tax=Rhodopseudomonas sp. TaxID=1078 RepID=UPI0017CCECF0|nr:hypothetical protein [Rhodopseudomonas sp.]NVN85551.1 hypothetical protein [Rhodopseudomonas sp.]
MTRWKFTRTAVLALACVSAALSIGVAGAQAPQPATSTKAMNIGDVLTGQLNAMRSRAKGKRISTFQLVSEPRRLPPPSGLCNLETGPETFQIVTASDAEAAQLKGLIGKEISLKVTAVACAEEAGVMSEAVVTKWSVVGKP